MKLTRINILYPILLLALIFFILTFNLIKIEYSSYESLTVMKERVHLSTKLSSIVHQIQRERGLSIAYLVSKDDKFFQDLEKQRKKTDSVINIMKNKISSAIIHIKEVQNIRSMIDKQELNTNEILQYYSNLNDQLLNNIVNIAQNSTSPEITRDLISYSNFLFSKELVGIQRAIGTEIISAPSLKQKQILDFYALIIRQEQYKEKLFKHAPQQYKTKLQLSIDKNTQAKITKMENTILSLEHQSIEDLNAKVWFTTLTKKINNLTLLEEYFSDEIIKNIETELGSVQYTFILNIVLNIVSILTFLFIVIFILQLIKNERKLQKLTNEYIISSTTDTRGLITSASQAFIDISGYNEEELIGHPHNVVRHRDMASEAFKELWKIIKNGDVWVGEVKNKKKNGEYYWTKSSIIPEFDSKNKIIGYTSLRHDITSEKSKEEFMANMSHELRTPLNSIIGFSDILNKQLKDSNHLKYNNRINTSAKVLLKLINDILDLSKIKDSKFTIEPYEFNAYDEIYKYSDTFMGLTSPKNISLEIDIDEKLQGLFFGDWIRISQVILNIISNAIKFTPKDGKIHFIVEYTNNNLLFSVEDNGIGMKKEVQDKIFRPFEQADGSTTRKYGGTGLGLSITQNLVELMKGNISLESSEGVGSKFSITLPLKKIKDLKSQAKVASTETYTNKMYSDHILVAEDNASNQMLIELLLQEFGITCDIVNDGEEAVNKYDPNVHSFILMDENMPKMNGIVAMKILKEKYKKDCGKIISLTANTMSGDKEKFLKLGMDDYLSKPIDLQELEKILSLYAKEEKVASLNNDFEDFDYLVNALELTKEKTNFSEEIIKNLTIRYHKSAIKLLKEFKKGIDTNDFEAIKNSAHNLKSTSQSLNYIEIGKLSEKAESKASKEEAFNYQEVYEAIDTHLRLLKSFIDTQVKG